MKIAPVSRLRGGSEVALTRGWGLGLRAPSARALLVEDSDADSQPEWTEEAREALLIQKAQRGDREAFTAIMKLYRERIVRMAYHMIGDHEEAQDLCQETFVKAYRALGRFDAGRPFSPWLYRIAHNVTLDHLRRRKARPVISDPESEFLLEDNPDHAAENPQQSLLMQEMRREVVEAIQSLPDNYRSVIVFRYLDDLSYGEIAETLNLTEANVMMRMSRARRMLKEKLNRLRAEDSSL
jgi:RNA polymerase sigma-70 factor (ECF subfamily)